MKQTQGLERLPQFMGRSGYNSTTILMRGGLRQFFVDIWLIFFGINWMSPSTLTRCLHNLGLFSLANRPSAVYTILNSFVKHQYSSALLETLFSLC